jgi:hypothetical protein
MTGPNPSHVLPTVGATRNGSALLDMLFVGRDRVSRRRYEDLTTNRFVELGRLSTELGVPVNKNRIADESVTLAPNHLADGNPFRFLREVTIRRDDEWVSATPRSTKLLVRVATTPLLLKYGYSLSGTPPKARQ